METPKSSIAAVTYRDKPSTQRFIESAYESTKEPFEMILVDNGSTADVATYLNDFASKHENFRVVRNSSNMGIGPAMNQAMRACTTDYIFRCDTDVVIQTAYWTTFMKEMADAYPEVGAVGTAITSGSMIKRNGYMESDICLSNCMLIPRRTINSIDRKMKEELPRISKLIAQEAVSGKSRYDGYFTHLGGMLNYMHYHGGLWDINFPYGADDFHYSLLIRYAGLRISKDDRVSVFHKDDSLRPEWAKERDRRVNVGFQYYRTFWEKMLEFDQVTDMWACWPINKKYASELTGAMPVGGL